MTDTRIDAKRKPTYRRAVIWQYQCPECGKLWEGEVRLASYYTKCPQCRMEDQKVGLGERSGH